MLLKVVVLMHACMVSFRCVFACPHGIGYADFCDAVAICSLNSIDKFPSVLVALLVRNKAHILPHVLTYLIKQNYPKKRIILWIRSDHNYDNSGMILKLWVNHTLSLYHSVDLLVDDRAKRYRSEKNRLDWTLERHHHHMTLKENALKHARKIGVDFVFFLDADVLLTNEETISHLVSLRLPIVAPLLQSAGQNYHFEIPVHHLKLFKNTSSLMEVFIISHAVMININHSGAQNLTFDMKRLFVLASQNKEQCLQFLSGYMDNCVFASSAICAKIPMLVEHQNFWGYFLEVNKEKDAWEEELLEVIDLKLEIVMDLGTIADVPKYFHNHVYTAEMIFPIVFEALNPVIYGKYNNSLQTNMLLDEIYMINLNRRPERLAKMEKLFKILGMEVTRFPAVDPQNMDILEEYDITLLPEFKDPSQRCGISIGEIGCFLSHYNIWKKIVAKQQDRVLILEDDIRFGPCFKLRLIQLMEHAQELANYDLLYLGRLRICEENEPWFKAKNGVQYVDYSYWTIGYILTLEGAKKLLAAKPLEKMLPVDKFLPIMYGACRNKNRTYFYPVRNLIALGAERDLIAPITDLQQQEWKYISDTHNSLLIT